jgi:hypothetical protein
LERYVLFSVSQHFRKVYPGQTIEVLTHPRIILPDGSDFELDVLIACDSIVLWFECKTGKDYPAYLGKYGVVAKKLMELATSNAAIILLEELTDPAPKPRQPTRCAMYRRRALRRRVLCRSLDRYRSVATDI